MKVYVELRQMPDRFEPIALVIAKDDDGEKILKADGTWVDVDGAIALTEEMKLEVRRD